MTEEDDIARRIERLHDDSARSTPAFQSVLGAVLRILDDVYRGERAAAASAISLGHSETMNQLVDEIRLTSGKLSTLLVRPTPGHGSTPPESGIDSWWYALAEATQQVEEAVTKLSSLVASQPRGSAVRGLVGEVIRVLRSHQRLLTGEATRWIEG